MTNYTATLQIQEANGEYRSATPEEILHAARKTLNRRFRRGKALTSPNHSKEYLQVQLGPLAHEVFAILWLDNRHQILEFETLFRGTIDGASVYPREVVKAALQHGAAACILAHNHPSGISDPSEADKRITTRLKAALELVDVRLLDHVVIGETCTSMAELGLI
jgi:DNA repair protein RadC